MIFFRAYCTNWYGKSPHNFGNISIVISEIGIHFKQRTQHVDSQSGEMNSLFSKFYVQMRIKSILCVLFTTGAAATVVHYIQSKIYSQLIHIHARANNFHFAPAPAPAQVSVICLVYFILFVWWTTHTYIMHIFQHHPDPLFCGLWNMIPRKFADPIVSPVCFTNNFIVALSLFPSSFRLISVRCTQTSPYVTQIGICPEWQIVNISLATTTTTASTMTSFMKPNTVSYRAYACVCVCVCAHMDAFVCGLYPLPVMHGNLLHSSISLSFGLYPFFIPKKVIFDILLNCGCFNIQTQKSLSLNAEINVAIRKIHSSRKYRFQTCHKNRIPSRANSMPAKSEFSVPYSHISIASDFILFILNLILC